MSCLTTSYKYRDKIAWHNIRLSCDGKDNDMSGKNSRYRNTGLNTLLEIRVLLCDFASYDSLTFVVESIFLWRTAQRVQEQHEGRGENYCLRHTHIYL